MLNRFKICKYAYEEEEYDSLPKFMKRKLQLIRYSNDLINQ